MSITRICGLLVCGLATMAPCVDWARAAGDLDAEASWQVPSRESVRDDLLAWLKSQKTDPVVMRQVEHDWKAEGVAADGIDILERTTMTFALVDPRLGGLVGLCRGKSTLDALVESIAWMNEASVSPVIAKNARLLVARSLAQQNYFDEAFEQLKGLRPEDVVDPASLLFYRSVATYRLVKTKACLEATGRLLENKEVIPRRYATLARLMRADFAQFKEGTLDDISRQMRDVERHLDLGRAGRQVRMKEEDVIAKLDKLIKEEEDKQKGGSGGPGGTQSSSPAPDSMPLGGKGAGKVTRRNVGNSSGWGELPPKQREAAMQDIGRDFPAHYREVIEEYFREIARQK